MAQLVIAAAGAAVGGLVGGPVGMQVGWALGAAIGAQFGPKQNVQGPRLDDLKVTSGQYGDVIPWGAGHPRLAGQVWWSSARREISQTSAVGKGGGATQTSYTYEADMLFGLVDRTIAGVARVWLNGKLVWTAHVDSDTASVEAQKSNAPWARLTVYTGAADQLPDPVYEAAVGVGLAPAYRGRGSVFIEGLQLGNSGVVPNLTFEVVCEGTVTFLDRGFLCQFDTLTDATHVATELGPEPVLSGSAALNTSVKKWGASSLYVPTAGSAVTSATVTNAHAGKAWRFEGWVYWTGDMGSQGAVAIVASGTGRGVSFARHGTLGAYYASCASSVSGTSGVFGNAADRPPINTWVHVAIEQVPGQRVKIYDSHKGGFVTEIGTSIHVFADVDMGQVRLEAGAAAPFYVDSLLFRWFDDDEADQLYANGYTTPAGPFATPPYAYEVVDPADTSLQAVVEELCALADMPAGTYDATALAGVAKPVRALAVGQVASVRAVLEELRAAYFFDAYAADKLYFAPRAGASAATVAYDDLATGAEQPDAEALPMQLGSSAEVPAQVAVVYANVDADYTTAAEQSDRLLTGQVSTAEVRLPLAFTAAEAKAIADAMVTDGYASRVTGSMALPLGYAERMPTHVVTVPDEDGNTYRVRLVRRTDEGNLLRFDWVLDDATVVQSAGTTSGGYTPTLGVALPGSTEMVLLDVPLLRADDDTLGHYVAAGSSATAWPGASIQRSLDDVEYAEAAVVAERAVLGVTLTALGSWAGGHVFDETSLVTVDVGSGTLSSSTRAAMLADVELNAVAIGSEVLRFRSAALVSAGVYTLSGLLRGQRGTEWAMAGHAVGEPVVLLRAQGLRYVTIDLPSVGAARYYKGVTRGKALSSAASEAFTCQAVSLRPLPPVDVRCTVTAANEISLAWRRRTRRAGAFLATSGTPLGEASESYSVDVVRVSDGAVLRTIAASTPAAVYTAAQQAADGVSGAVAIRFDVHQLSATVGRGRAGARSTVGAVTPRAQITRITVGGSFASGAALYATLGGVTYSYTSTGGDATLAGIAASFAAVIDAAASYSAAAAGADIDVTGPVSAAFPVLVGVTAGDNTLTWALTQTASATVAGVSNEITFTWLNLADPAGANAYPLGMTFYLTVQRVSPPLYLNYGWVSTPSGLSDYRVRTQAAQGIASAVADSGDDAAYGFRVVVDPADNWTVRLYTPASEPYNWTGQAQTSQPGVAGLAGDSARGVTPAIARPQVCTLTLAGTPTTGWVYRATLGGVAYDYTATGGDTTMSHIATGLAAVIDAAASYLASAVGAVITITHASNNVPFTYSARVVPSTVTLSASTIQEAA